MVIATEDSNIGMGGPAMIEGGGLGIFRPEEVGPIDVQSRNGVVDVRNFLSFVNADPPVNVIQLPFREGAASAVELLIRLIEGDESAPRNLTLPADYVRRGSVGSPLGVL